MARYDYDSREGFSGEEESAWLERDELTDDPDELEQAWEDDAWMDERDDPYRDDVEADADTLRDAGYGTDEDYGYYGE